MDRAADALLDSRDESARRLRADQELLANRFCKTTRESSYGFTASITWSPDELSFTSTCRDERAARWSGYRTLAEIRSDLNRDDVDLVFWGTTRTEDGYAAQFTLMDNEGLPVTVEANLTVPE